MFWIMTVLENPWAKTYPESMHDQRDFRASAVIDLPKKELPKNYSLWQFIARTNYQNGWGSCTANSTCHALQAMAVKDEFWPQDEENKLTPIWEHLWGELMGHDLNNKDDSGDYLETAIKNACKEVNLKEWGKRGFSGYSFESYNATDKDFLLIKQYLYNGFPLLWVIDGNRTTWGEMNLGEVISFIPGGNRTGGHAICCIGYDEGGLWFLNSRHPNDWKGKKSRFYISFATLRKLGSMVNWRYFVPFYKAKVDVNHIKQENTAILVIKALKQMHADTSYQDIKEAIEGLSKTFRSRYKRINEEVPLK